LLIKFIFHDSISNSGESHGKCLVGIPGNAPLVSISEAEIAADRAEQWGMAVIA
jgi:hypothetical protein